MPVSNDNAGKWSTLTEEQKYFEWSFAIRVGSDRTFEDYCDFWDEFSEEIGL